MHIELIQFFEDEKPVLQRSRSCCFGSVRAVYKHTIILQGKKLLSYQLGLDEKPKKNAFTCKRNIEYVSDDDSIYVSWPSAMR